MNNIKVILTNIKKNFKNAKELKASFTITVVGMAINNIAFLFLWYYFGKTVGVLNGWEAMDIFGLYAFNGVSYGIVSSFFAGVNNIPTYITSGNMDKFLLTPKNILLKISTSTISTSALGDLLFGVVCFLIFLFYKELTFIQILLCLLFMATASIITFAFNLISVSVSFYLMDGNNISQSLYSTFISNSLYHGGAFTGILRVFFMFVIPALLVGAIPVEILKNPSINNILFIVIFSIIWLSISILFFYKSLKKYESNNLFGFGS